MFAFISPTNSSIADGVQMNEMLKRNFSWEEGAKWALGENAQRVNRLLEVSKTEKNPSSAVEMKFQTEKILRARVINSLLCF